LQGIVSKKRLLLDEGTQATGQNRKDASWLLNHAEEVQQTREHPRRRTYGPDVQHALFLAWNAANCICAKRLMPFLPPLVEAASAAWTSAPDGGVPEPTALDEREPRRIGSYAPDDNTVLAGSPPPKPGRSSKRQIPIRTFQDWNETQPGLTSSRSGCPLWERSGGRLLVYLDPDGHRDRLD